MKNLRDQRAVALITVLAIMGIFLLVALLILSMASQNSLNFGNAYQKQRYYDVAEAGIDRGLRDLNSSLPSPGSSGTAAPAPPTPSANQTPLPNVPNVGYYYSYWSNPGNATSTPDPLAGPSFGVTAHAVNVPAFGAVIWSHTTTGLRDVAVEAVVSRIGTSTASCAICAGGGVTVTGSQNFSPPPTVCGSTSNPYKICSDPKASPSPAPAAVPIISGGAYTCSGAAANAAPCDYGAGASTPNPTVIQQNAPPSMTGAFLESQSAIDQLSNAAAWKTAAASNPNIKYIDCPSGCDTPALSPFVPTSSGQVTYVNGSISMSSKTVLSYGGIFIVNGCLSISQPGLHATTTTAGAFVLGTDSQCGGTAVTFQGGGNTKPPLWDGGTLYAMQGSVSIAGNGSVKGYNFYGAIVAAGSVTVTGNGFFAWESALASAQLAIGPFVIDSFAQY